MALATAGMLVAGLGLTFDSQAATVSPAQAAGRSYTVTLLTGDVVSVRTGGSGCPQVTVRPATADGVLLRGCGPDGHVRVVPARVAPLIGDVFDPALFDVTAMIQDGYDDARTPYLPLIVRPGGGSTGVTADPVVTGLSGRRALPSIAAVAGRQGKVTGVRLVESLAGRAATTLKAGAMPKVWLDRRVHATAIPSLDPNLTQISAPQAWTAGYTGTGSRVAVLDTGVDPTHPDLAGQIAESKDFTVDGGDAADHFGHGTHVAATIAGTGAASLGARKGVAPGARLLVGKVLGDEGEGSDSQVIAGMEWAASRADVVNMSLGNTEPSDGTDPLSLALDTLSEQTGALFVVAAGNSGPADGTISSPSAAARALTVGAVDGDDVLADFSSRGPLVGTRALKPELVAPGVGIVAARAAGTSLGTPVDDLYTAVSGTSMAAPHVAGAAAVLAQRHPDWRAEQLKAALVGAADPISGGDAYSSGAGRLDVARSLSTVVSAQAVVGLGILPYPQSGTAEARPAWTNTGNNPASVALDLTVADHNGVAGPAGGVTLSATRVHLAAGETGGVVLRLDRAAFASRPGLWTATVTASAGGAVIARTTVAFYIEPPSYDLTVETSTIPGTPAGASGWLGVQVVNLDDPAVYAGSASGGPGDTLTLRLPAGRYSVMGSLASFAGDDERAALAGDPDVAIAGDTTVLLDFAQAKPVTAGVDGVTTEADEIGVTYVQSARRGPAWTDSVFAQGDAAKDGNVFVAPNDGAGAGSFRAYATYGLTAPGSRYDLIRSLGNGIPADPAYQVTAVEKAQLARIDERFHTLDMPGSGTSHGRYGYSPEGVNLGGNRTRGLSGDRTDYVSSGFDWAEEANWNGTVVREAMARYAPGSRQEKAWIRQPLHSDWYDDPAVSPNSCQPLAPARTSGRIHIEMVTLADQHQRFDCLAYGELDIPRTLTLQRDGQTVAEVTGSTADFTVPAEAADYRLTYDVDASAALPVSTRISTSWTFRSTGPSGTGSTPLPLLAVDYALPLDTANHPTADGTATFTVRQARGVPEQAVTSFTLAVSLDGGNTWQPATLAAAGDGTYQATLPQPAAGQSVSLRVAAQGGAGSGIEQTIVDAYRAE